MPLMPELQRINDAPPLWPDLPHQRARRALHGGVVRLCLPPLAPRRRPSSSHPAWAPQGDGEPAGRDGMPQFEDHGRHGLSDDEGQCPLHARRAPACLGRTCVGSTVFGIGRRRNSPTGCRNRRTGRKRSPSYENGRPRRMARRMDGAQGRNRTSDTAIFSRMLYQLSYLGPLGVTPLRGLRGRGAGDSGWTQACPPGSSGGSSSAGTA